MNTFGHCFRITSFGESHGGGLGVVIDGCPPNLELSESDIQTELDRRRPGQSDITTPRNEGDKCEILSGVFEGKTTGCPIAVIVRNENQQSKDYTNIKDVFRPSHADYGFLAKYGIRDHRGGGRSSGRETIARVIGGAVASKVLRDMGVDIYGFSRMIGGIEFESVDRDFIEKNTLRMADEGAFEKTLNIVEQARDEGDSLGGVVEIRVKNPPVGLGSPVFGKLEADLAKACMSVGATKGFEMGEGFALAHKKGSEANDPFIVSSKGQEGKSSIETKRNANGGVLGGISTGDDIWFRVAIKPTSSISKPQRSANTSGEEVDLEVKGRHDPIIVPRVIPVLEAMTALVLIDHVMMHRAQNS